MLILLDIGIFAFGSTADAQEVVFATSALHLGRLGYGMMVTAAGAGYVLGASLLSVTARRVSTGSLIGLGALLSSSGYLVYALAHGFGQAVIGLIILGVFGAAKNVGLTTYRQHAVPIASMGRLNNLLGPVEQVLAISLMLVGGYAASLVGVRAVMIDLTGSACILGAISLYLAMIATGNRQQLARAGADHSG